MFALHVVCFVVLVTICKEVLGLYIYIFDMFYILTVMYSF